VKLLAAPGLPPGPCEAKAAVAHNAVTTADVAANAKFDTLLATMPWQSPVTRNFQKTPTTAYSGFENP